MPLLLGIALAAGMSGQFTVEMPTDRGRGRHLYQACKAMDRVNALPSGQNAAPADKALASECWGYIEGWVDALLDGSGALEARGICPHEFTIPQMAHGYVVFLEKHPEMMNMETGTALRASLQQQFPCKK